MKTRIRIIGGPHDGLEVLHDPTKKIAVEISDGPGVWDIGLVLMSPVLSSEDGWIFRWPE